jgi:hypothetical protein
MSHAQGDDDDDDDGGIGFLGAGVLPAELLHNLQEYGLGDDDDDDDASLCARPAHLDSSQLPYFGSSR